ncbi:Hypothetical predicted protein [Octopus vulgaris]|uniref:DUF4817 domain-containing protein n=1 Tax=Octopus vulgaris TaxID=6645 RepID=A0AA36FJU3_OCTVU|nr:Hypothetical predicted protein [Octopus vulgaris]
MAQQLTLEQRCKIAAWLNVLQFPTAVQHKFEKACGRHSAPTRSTIYATRRKCLETGSVVDKPRRGRPPTTTTDENTELKEQKLDSVDAPKGDKALIVLSSGSSKASNGRL